MGLFKKKTRSAVLVDIGSASVGGAYVHIVEGKAPQLCYTARIPVVRHEQESITASMLRALDQLVLMLVSEGGPALYREVGNAHIDMIVASVAAPWQETTVRTVSLQEKYPFTFTRLLMQRAVTTKTPPPGRVVSDTSVIATTLNGYATENPWGKRVTRADLTVLTSTIEKLVVHDITKTLQSAFHSHHVEITAFAPVSFAVITDLYPHQQDFIVIDVSGTATDALIVKKGIIAGVRSIPHGIHDLLSAARVAARSAPGADIIVPERNAAFAPKVESIEIAWLSDLKQVLSEFAQNTPLPRAVFLLADDDAREFLKRLIDNSSLRTLWLSGDSLSIITFAPEHTASAVTTRGLAEGDVFLSMLALFYRERLMSK